MTIVQFWTFQSTFGQMDVEGIKWISPFLWWQVEAFILCQYRLHLFLPFLNSRICQGRSFSKKRSSCQLLFLTWPNWFNGAMFLSPKRPSLVEVVQKVEVDRTSGRTCDIVDASYGHHFYPQVHFKFTSWTTKIKLVLVVCSKRGRCTLAVLVLFRTTFSSLGTKFSALA